MKKLLIPGQAEKLYFQIPSRFLTIGSERCDFR